MTRAQFINVSSHASLTRAHVGDDIEDGPGEELPGDGVRATHLVGEREGE